MGLWTEQVVDFGFKPASHSSSSHASLLLDFRGSLGGLDFFNQFWNQPRKGSPISVASKQTCTLKSQKLSTIFFYLSCCCTIQNKRKGKRKESQNSVGRTKVQFCFRDMLVEIPGWHSVSAKSIKKVPSPFPLAKVSSLLNSWYEGSGMPQSWETHSIYLIPGAGFKPGGSVSLYSDTVLIVLCCVILCITVAFSIVPERINPAAYYKFHFS